MHCIMGLFPSWDNELRNLLLHKNFSNIAMIHLNNVFLQNDVDQYKN